MSRGSLNTTHVGGTTKCEPYQEPEAVKENAQEQGALEKIAPVPVKSIPYDNKDKNLKLEPSAAPVVEPSKKKKLVQKIRRFFEIKRKN